MYGTAGFRNLFASPPLSGKYRYILQMQPLLAVSLSIQKTVQKKPTTLGKPLKMEAHYMDGMKVETEPEKFCDWKQVWVGRPKNGGPPINCITILCMIGGTPCGCTKKHRIPK